jgi:hypothetical protein
MSSPAPSISTRRTKPPRPTALRFCACNLHKIPHDATQTDFVRREAEEASWSVLRAELTRQAGYTHTRDLEAACARTTAELSAMCERNTAIIEVLHE